METKAVEARTGGRWKRRLLVVVGAVVAAAVAYLIINAVVGDLSAPSMNGQEGTDITIGAVIMVSALASLLGWGLLALLERFSGKGRLIWTIVALVVLVLSLGGPLGGTDVTTGNRIGLLLLHIVVAAVLIPFLPGPRTSTEQPAG